jgi:MFS family permease
MVGAIGLMLTSGIGLLVREPHWAVLTIGAMLFFASQPVGIAAAAVQSITPVAMRGRVSAIYLFAQTGTGSVLGPLIPGVLADKFFGTHEHFGVALLLPAVVLGFLMLAFMAAARPAFVALTSNVGGTVP